MKKRLGLTSFCQIFLYLSYAGSGDAAKDFKSEWNGRTGYTSKATV
jgi:hypothetical protein